MRIVYLHQYFKTPQMNGGTRSYEMARRWAAQGHTVHIVTSDSDRTAGGWRTYDVDGVTVHACPVPYSNSMTFRRRVQAFGQFGVAASLRARRLNGDVVFATSTPLTIVVPALYATILRRSPMVFEVRDLWPELPIAIGALKNPVGIALARALEIIAYRSARMVVALSPGMAEGVIRRGTPASKVVVAPNSCDLDKFDVPASVGLRYRQQQPWLGQRPLIVYCGTLGQINNAGYLVDVAKAMGELDPDVAFGIFGVGAEEALIRKNARNLGVLDRNLFMMGEVPKEQMPAILSAATVCTSLFLPLEPMQANSANKFFDALAAGRPVAINYGGWHADLLRVSGAGLAISPNDSEESARQLHAFIHDRDALDRAAYQARKLAMEEFARDTISDRVLDAVCSARPVISKGDPRIDGRAARSESVPNTRSQHPVVPRMKGRKPVPDFDVAHVTTVHVPTDNRIAMKECAALVKAGVRVCLIACGGPAPTVEGLTFIELPKQPGRAKRLVLGNRDAWRALRKARPTVVHVHDPELIPLAFAYKLRFKGKAIYDAHEELGKQIAGKPYLLPFFRKPVALVGHLLEGLANRAMDGIVVATAKIGHRYSPTKVTLVQNYPWRDAFDTSYQPKAPSTRNVAYVGAITVERGIREMIEAVGECDPNVKLILAGPAAASAKQAIEMAPQARVEYLGPLPATEVPGILANAFAGLAVLHALPNYVESQPTKVYEYMAAGRPFVASNFECWVEQFGSSECGIFVDPTDVGQVKRAIDRLAADPDLANAMGRRGRSEFLSRFTFEQEAAKLVERMKTLLDEQRNGLASAKALL